MSILNVNQIQPVGSGQTVTISAANIDTGSATVTAGTFTGNLTGNVTGSVLNATSIVGVNTVGVVTVYASGSLQTNSIVPLDGLPAGASGGGIIQCVTNNYTSRFSSSGNGWSVITGFNATITPQSTSSKILVMVFIGVIGTSTGESYSTAFRIKRAGTVVLQGADQGNNRDQASFRYFSGVNQDHGASAGIVGLDSPATTSSTQYTVELNPQDGTTTTINYEQRNNNVADSYSMDCMSSITLLEVTN